MLTSRPELKVTEGSADGGVDDEGLMVKLSRGSVQFKDKLTWFQVVRKRA